MSKHNKQDKNKMKFLDKLISPESSDVSKIEYNSHKDESWLKEDGTIMLSFLLVFFLLCYIFDFSLIYITPLLVVAFIMYKVRKVALDSRKFKRMCRKIKAFTIGISQTIKNKFKFSSNEVDYRNDYRLLDV